MGTINFEDMDEMHFDVLKEIGNIGAGNATTALAQLLRRKVDMKVPKVELLDFSELSDIVGGAESIVVGILLTFEGDIQGMMMFILEKNCAHCLVNMLMGKNIDNFEEFTDIDMSALKEIGNIITGAYLYSLGSLTNMTIVESVPYLAIDMAGAILSVPAIELGKLGDKALLIQSQFGDDSEDDLVNGFFILIPDLESYVKILEALGIKI